MSPMILSDRVAEIIKDLNIKISLKDIALDGAACLIDELKKEIAELKSQVEELVVEVAELEERLREG